MREETGIPNQGNWNKVGKDKRAGNPSDEKEDKAVEP